MKSSVVWTAADAAFIAQKNNLLTLDTTFEVPDEYARGNKFYTIDAAKERIAINKFSIQVTGCRNVKRLQHPEERVAIYKAGLSRQKKDDTVPEKIIVRPST